MVSSSTASESPAAGPRVWVVRHGETEWSRAHRHTSVTDLPLTEVGEQAAVALRERLVDSGFELAETMEVLHRGWNIDGMSVRPDHRMVAHTGFLTHARLLPS